MKRILAMLMALVMVITTAISVTLFDGNKKAVAAEKPETMMMPVVIYDHLDDRLLFQYDLMYAMNLSLFETNEYSGEDIGTGGKDLVENELGPNGTPVYKKEIVEKVAKLVKDYIDQGYGVNNDLYHKVVDGVTKSPASTKEFLTGKEKPLGELGWDFNGLNYADNKWTDAYGNVIWKVDNDKLLTPVGGAGNAITYNFGELEPATYRIGYWASSNVTISVINTDTMEEKDVTASNSEFVVPSVGNYILKVVPGTGEAFYTAPNLYKNDAMMIPNFTKPKTVSATQEGFKISDGSSFADGNAFAGGDNWATLDGWIENYYSGIACGNNTDTYAYIDVDVEAGSTYTLSFMNEANLSKIKVLAGETVLAESETGKTDEFKVPAGVDTIRIAVYGKGEGSQANGNRKVASMKLTKKAVLELGNYATSKAKYDGGAKFNDISSCMDYAYYMLNNFWTDTNGDITKKTSLYRAIRLDLVGQNYVFDNSYKLNYNLDTGIVTQNVGTAGNEGFFPLDSSKLGTASDLTSPYGKDDEINNHNFHYAMKAHCEFVYDKSENLEFNFRGDDDVYLFIDGKLALDIGGAHTPLGGSVNLNELATKIGLVDGETYSFDFFYMERHTDISNIRIETNMMLESPSAKASVKYKDATGKTLGTGSTVSAGDPISIEYAVTANSNNMSNVTFVDKDLGVTIGEDGVNLGSKGVYVDDAIVVTVTDSKGNVTKTIKITKDELSDPAKVAAFTEAVGKVNLNKKDTMTVSGIKKDASYSEVMKSDLDVKITYPESEFDVHGNLVDVDVDVDVDEVMTNVVPKAEPKASVEVEFVDNKGDKLSSPVDEGTPVGLVYTLKAESVDMSDIGLTDAGTGFSISKSGVVIPDGYNIDGGLTVQIKDKDGVVKATHTVTAADISGNSDNYKDLLNKLKDQWLLKEGDTVTFTGLSTTMGTEDIDSDVTASVTGPKTSYDEGTETVTVVPTAVKPKDKAGISAQPKLKVTFTVDDPTHGSLTGKDNYEVKENETTGNQPTTTPEEGFEFVKWTKTVGTVTTDVTGDPQDEVITADTVFTAIFAPKSVTYTVKYVDEDGNDIATMKTETSTVGANVTETPVTVSGYKPVDTSLTQTMVDGTNEIVFVYKKVEITTGAPVTYTVKYVNENGTEIATSKTGSSNVGESVTENAVGVTGYTPTKTTITQTMVDGTNEIVFVYKKEVETTKKVEETTKKTTKPKKKAEKETTKKSTTKKPSTKKPDADVLPAEESHVDGNGSGGKGSSSGSNSDGNSNTSTISPKTGYAREVMYLFGLMMMAAVLGAFSFAKFKKIK